MAAALEARIRGARGLALVAALALAVFVTESVAWPLAQGRDAGTFLGYYLELWHSKPLFPQLMLFRTPGAPLLFGSTMSLGGANLAEAVMAVSYAVAVAAVVAGARMLGPRVAIATAVALLLYVPYGVLFHTVSSDGPFALGFALWIPLVVRTMLAPSVVLFAFNGAWVVVLILIRPASQLLILFALAAFVVALPLRRRLLAGSAFLAVVLGLLAAWAGFNDLRYGEFTVSRGLGAQELYRAFVYDHLVQPGNGTHSRQLAKVVTDDLLPREPYRSYRIDQRQFFGAGSARMWSDLVSLSDRRFGWDSDYKLLGSVAREAVEKHPGRYALNVARSLRVELDDVYAPPAFTPPHRRPRESSGTRRLPMPTEGQPIPASNLDWLASTPDESIRMDWSSLQRPRLVFRDPSLQRRYGPYARRLDHLLGELPSRPGSQRVASALHKLAWLYPRMPIWLALGALGALFHRNRAIVPALALCVIALIALAATALVQPATVAYRIPFDPAFILFGIAGLARTTVAR